MFSSILVPTDFSPPSAAALACARELAGRFGASLHLLHVAESVFLRAVSEDPRERRDALLRQLQTLLPAEEQRRVALTVAVERSDEPADEIARHARVEDIRLIVMGTHGRTGLSRLLIGSVAEKVVRRAACPVLTVRRPAPLDAEVARPAQSQGAL
jgi:universal stress protein A